MRKIYLLIFFIALFSCQKEQEAADVILYNGVIYTVDSTNSVVSALAISDGSILATGDKAALEVYQGKETEMIDLEGRMATPGIVESHAHILGVGYNVLQLDLLGVKSYEEMAEKVAEAVAKAEPGEWILGRGWHQSKWDTIPGEQYKGFPTNKMLSEVSPDNPVFLKHASGHAAIANEAAVRKAGVNVLARESFQQIIADGGEVITDSLGNPTGIFVEPAAMNKIASIIPNKDERSDREALLTAIAHCHEFGITSFHDAGAARTTINVMQQLREKDSLDLRLYVMLTGWDRDLLEDWFARGIMVDSSDQLTIRSVKLNSDGALGSRGAWLLEPYTDRAHHYGFPTLPMDYAREITMLASEAGFQVCSHAIGDRTNREILDIYEDAIDTFGLNDHRYRIEHAQHLHPDDIGRFAELGVIPAMQAIHMSSDRPWAIDRLGKERIKEGAYVWRALLDSGSIICNGTDAPVEPIDPIPSFYASVTRKTLEGRPPGGFEPEQRMTREEALRSYTIWGAEASFMEDRLGSLEPGKWADVAVWSQDFMQADEEDILDIHTIMTMFNGKIVHDER